MPTLTDLAVDQTNLVKRKKPVVTRAAEWSSKFINDLPDSSFGYVAPGGKKDATGRTVPRSLRYLPYKNEKGEIDLPHLRNALSRLPQTSLPANVKASIKAKLEKVAQENLKGALSSQHRSKISQGLKRYYRSRGRVKPAGFIDRPKVSDPNRIDRPKVFTPKRQGIKPPAGIPLRPKGYIDRPTLIRPKKMLSELPDRFVTFIDIEASENATLPTMVRVVPVGKTNTTKYGELEIKQDDISKMVENFEKRVRGIGVPVDVDHPNPAAGQQTKAAGWVKKLMDRGREGLWAAIEWTEYGMDLVGKKLYKGISPEFSFDYVDSETSEKHGPTLIAVTLTNRPMFQHSLAALSASEEASSEGLKHAKNKVLLTFNEATMSKDEKAAPEAVEETKTADDSEESKKVEAEMPMPEMTDEEMQMLESIKQKKVGELSEEELAFLAEHLMHMSEEDQKTYASVLESAIKSDEPEEGDEMVEEEVSESKVEAQTPQPVAASEKVAVDNSTEKVESVTLKADEVAALKKQADEGIKATEELRRMKVESEVTNTLLFSEKGGKVMPKAKDALTKLVLSFSESQRALFDKVMEAVPAKTFSELGSSESEPLDRRATADKLIADRIAASEKIGKKLSRFDATVELMKEKPELFKAN